MTGDEWRVVRFKNRVWFGDCVQLCVIRDGKAIQCGPIACHELALRATVQEMYLACDLPTIEENEVTQ